jgi:co-chaperonin GroES (HSP10)
MILKEEILKRGLDPDIINKMSLIGDRVLILLDEALDHTTTETGIIIPLSNVIEKDSGRLGTELSKRKHLTEGVVIALSSTASSKLGELNTNLSPGDRVYVNEMVMKTPSSYQFFIDRKKLVQDFNGVVCIPHVLIEAKIN